MNSLSQRTAQTIVDTIKDVCGFDINYIHPDGTIFASTNPLRINTYHEIGRQVALTRETIEITDHTYEGTSPGVNIPFYYQGDLIAVIGISGQPDDVRQYGILAQKVTTLILKELDLGSIRYQKQAQRHYLINAIIGEETLDEAMMEHELNDFPLHAEDDIRTIIFHLKSRDIHTNLSSIEEAVTQWLRTLQTPMYTFNFPNDYILLIPERDYQQQLTRLEQLAQQHPDALLIGIGSKQSLLDQHQSYRAAQLALRSLKSHQNIARYDNLTIEILLAQIDDTSKQDFLKQTINNLTREEHHLLTVYYESNASLKQTAEQLFLHKNTVQYQLNQIAERAQLNPRVFHDAVTLYVALLLGKE